VWVGMDQPQPIMEKGYGSALALPIWVDFMSQVPEKTYPTTNFEAPFQVTKVRLCSHSGLRATSQCQAMQISYESTLPSHRVPHQTCHLHPEPAPVYATQPYPAEGRYYTYPSSADPYSRASGSAPLSSRPQVAPPASRPSPAIAGDVQPAAPTPRYPGIDQTEPTTTIDSSSPATTGRMHVERTSRGLVIYPVRSQPPSQQVVRRPVRVMRAIPVDPDDRVEPDEDLSEGGVRIYRGRPVERGQSEGRRVVRIVPAEE